MKSCEKCGKEFAPVGSGAGEKRHCSRECQNTAWYARNREKILAHDADYRDAERAKLAAYRAKRRAECIAYLGGKCVQCGSTDELDIDHIDPSTKSFKISNRLNSRWSILEPELRKCQLLCRPCHIVKTEPESRFAAAMLRAGRRAGSRGKAVAFWQHGTYSGYKHACRCEPCRAAFSAYERDYYARNRDEIRTRRARKNTLSSLRTTEHAVAIQFQTPEAS
jgi:hypothetical protein